MSLSNLFLIRFLKFLVLSFGVVANIVSISGMAIDDLNYFNSPLHENKKVQKVCSRILRKICKNRSSPPEVFLGKTVLKICNKFTGEHPC